MQDAMDFKSDMTTNMMGPVTSLMSSKSEGLKGVTNHPATYTLGPEPPSMGPHTANPITSPLLNLLGGSFGGSNPEMWVWMWLESSHFHMLLTYQTEMSTIAVVLVQITGHAPIHMQ